MGTNNNFRSDNRRALTELAREQTNEFCNCLNLSYEVVMGHACSNALRHNPAAVEIEQVAEEERTNAYRSWLKNVRGAARAAINESKRAVAELNGLVEEINKLERKRSRLYSYRQQVDNRVECLWKQSPTYVAIYKRKKAKIDAVAAKLNLKETNRFEMDIKMVYDQFRKDIAIATTKEEAEQCLSTYQRFLDKTRQKLKGE